MATFKSKILSFNNYEKKTFLFLLDNFICLTSFFLAFYLRLDLFFINETQNQLISFGILYTTFIILCFSFSFYQPLSRYYDLLNIAKIISVFFLYAFFMTLVFNYLKLHGIPRSVGFLHPIIFLILFISARVFAYLILRKFLFSLKKKHIVVCCKINSAETIKNILKNYNIVYFITDNINYEKRLIGNIPIYSFSNLNKSLIKENVKIDYIYIDTKLNSEKNRNKIITLFQKKNKPNIKIIPQIENFLDFQFKDDIKNINIFKKNIKFSSNKLKSKFKSASIFITGAGGSIGSELSKEIFKLEPAKITLIENSEFNLYKVLNDLTNAKQELNIKTLINYHLVSVTDYEKLRKLFEINKPDYVFHCAAFKHVPLVEENTLVAVENNFISTIHLCKLSISNKVSKLILISSDKAVKPSSVMGATKRLSELAIKYYAQKSEELNNKIIFSAVRFANVLNSSGSVVPLFARQVQAGGPITITDKKVERFFMTISDAVKLVLETTLISKNGNIMLLKMGKQIKIIDVARKIANFYGLTIKENTNPSGNIEIVEIGLRPGEKMKEELYYDPKFKKTVNKDILCVDNIKLKKDKFENIQKKINRYIDLGEEMKLRELLLNQENMF